MSAEVTQDDTGSEEFEAPLTGKTVRIYEDKSTPSGKNWEYVDE